MHSKTIYIEEGGFKIKAFLIFLTSISLIMLMTNGCTTSELKTGSIGSDQSKTEGSFPEFTLKVKIINHATDQKRFLLGIDRYGFENSKIAVFPSASTQIVDDKFNIRVKDGIKYTLSVCPTNMTRTDYKKNLQNKDKLAGKSSNNAQIEKSITFIASKKKPTLTIIINKRELNEDNQK